MRTAALVAAVVIALALAAGVIWTTRTHGIVVTADSVSYLRSAESFAERGVFRLPVTSWMAREDEASLVSFPPLLPAIYGSISRVAGVAPRRAAPWLNALVAAATAMILFTLAPRTPAGVICVAVFLVGHAFYPFHLVFWTEPLFLFFCAAICLVWRSSAPGSRWAPVSVGALAGLAALTRYAGVFFFPAMNVLFLADRAEPLRARLRRCLAFSATYAAIIGPWYAWVFIWNRRPTRLMRHPPVWNDPTILDTITRWVLPGRIPLKWRIAIVAAIALFLVIRLARKWAARAEPLARNGHARLEAAALVLAIGYVGFIYFVQRTLFPGVTSDNRILAPAALFMTASVAAGLAARPPAAWGRSIAVAVLALGVGAIGVRQTSFVVRKVERDCIVYRPVSSYTSPGWRDSETIRWLGTLGPEVTIFSNVPDVIALYLSIRTKYTPEFADRARLAEFGRRLEESAPSVLVLFDEQSRTYLADNEEILAALPLREARRFRDARVYTWGAVEERRPAAAPPGR